MHLNMEGAIRLPFAVWPCLPSYARMRPDKLSVTETVLTLHPDSASGTLESRAAWRVSAPHTIKPPGTWIQLEAVMQILTAENPH